MTTLSPVRPLRPLRPLRRIVRLPVAGLGLAGAAVLLAATHCGSSGDHPTPSTDAGTLSDATLGADGGAPGDASANDAASDAWVPPQLGTIVDAGSPGTVDITFAVHADQGAHAISPYIYGVNDGTRPRPTTRRSSAPAATA